MKPRACIGLSVLIGFFAALTLASSPQLHEKVHKVGTYHECAATLIASGKCEHTTPPAVTPKIQEAPVSPAFLGQHFRFVIAAVPSSIQEHAPPIAP